MDEHFELMEVIEGKEKYYDDQKFFNKLKSAGLKLGFKGLHTATVLYCALKSPMMPMKDKLIIVGALGYFILPLDVMADFLPVFGLVDDMAVVAKAFMTVYGSITDDMKEEAHVLLKQTFGEKYMLEEDTLIGM